MSVTKYSRNIYCFLNYSINEWLYILNNSWILHRYLFCLLQISVISPLNSNKSFSDVPTVSTSKPSRPNLIKFLKYVYFHQDQSFMSSFSLTFLPYLSGKFLLIYDDSGPEQPPVRSHAWPIFIDIIRLYYRRFSTGEWFFSTLPHGY